MTLGVAICGTGRIGGRYLDVVAKAGGAEVKVVAEPREEQVVDLKRANPNVDFVADYREALGRSDVNAVIMTLPHWLHAQAAIDAADAGKHIFIEKPMATSVKECDAMIAAVRANNVMLMTAHTQRYHPVVKKMKEVVDSKELGDVIMAHDVWHKPLDPHLRPEWMLDRSRGGGMGLMDGTHMIDRLLWILGPDVATVSARVGAFTYPDIKADDTAMCFLRWKGGPVATISRIAWRTGITEYGAEYFFTNGQAKFRMAYGRGADQVTAFWIGRQGTWTQVEVGQTTPLVDEFKEFVEALTRGDKDAPIPLAHGRNVIRVLEASEESSEQGREIVLDGRAG